MPEPDLIFKGSEDEKLKTFEVTEDRVRDVLLKIGSSKAAGPDGIPPSMLQALAEELSLPLAMIFNKSLNEGVVPQD